ncbi:MAG: ABC transporter substrate-binding protein [candidate division NC10 bacterium]|nr:ABC transporter substrate-binding protein [candidate division NC10 bacterium]
MRTRLGWVAVIVGVVFVLVSVGLASAQAKPIKIGQIIPITGEAAESGKYHKQGAEIAVDKINAAGGINGRKIQIVLEDDQTTNPGGVAALQKLLEDKEIPAILGSIRSTQVQAMLPTINEAKIPVAIGGTNYGLTHSGSQWVFRFRPHDGMSAKVIAKFMIEELKQKKVGIVHASDAFGNGGRDMLTPAVKELGGEVVFTQGFNNQEKDFTAVVQGLKKSGATGLGTYFTFGTDLGVFARQLKQQGVDVKWVGSPSITGVDSRNLAGDALWGTYGVTDFHVAASPTSKAFAEAYKAKFKQDPDLYAAWCYDAVIVFAEAMKKAPNLKADDLRKAILSIQKFPGAEGEYNFDQNGDGLDHYHIVQNEKGNIHYFKTLRVAR